MLHDRSGPRWDGQDWPPAGGEIDVPDDEAIALCEHGLAVPAADGDTHDTPVPAADAAVETRGAPIVNSPKAAWVEHAVSLGADRAGAEGSTKADLIAWVKDRGQGAPEG
jgi:hypothetical protein